MTKRTLITLILTFNIVVVYCQPYNVLNNNIYNDTTWSADTIKIFDNITVHENASLTIQGGTYIEFQGHYNIEVYGILKAIGTISDSIFFTINDTTSFSDTTTNSGGWGGIRFRQRDNNDTSYFTYCSFSYGKAVVPGNWGGYDEGNNGGSIYAIQYPNLIIRNSSFINNRANYFGGAISFFECNSVSIKDCFFKKNFVYNKGGGIYIERASNFSINNNIFYKNTAYKTLPGNVETGSGSGVYISYSASTGGYAIVESNEFYNNKSVDGTLYESCLFIIVVNNIIANNYGVGLAEGITTTYNALFENNTIVNNYGFIVPALWFNSTQTKMINNIIWGNGSASFFGYQIYDIDGSKTADISYSCIQDGYPGEGNIETYPEFVNPTQGYGLEYDALNSDWSLLDNSPCVNYGMPDTNGYHIPEFDIAGNPRVYGCRIDMGAFENQEVVAVYENIKGNNYTIGPNPVKDKLLLHLGEDADFKTIKVTNSTGQVIKFINNPEVFSLYTVDFSDDPAGLYFVHFESDNGIVKTEKVIKL